MAEERREPPRLGESSAAGLIAYYREHGESEHVAAVEAALTDEWQTTVEITRASGKSQQYCRNALEYLAVERRATREIEELDKPFRGVWWRYLWKHADGGT